MILEKYQTQSYTFQSLAWEQYATQLIVSISIDSQTPELPHPRMVKASTPPSIPHARHPKSIKRYSSVTAPRLIQYYSRARRTMQART